MSTNRGMMISWLIKLWHIYTMKYYIAINKKSKLDLYILAWEDVCDKNFFFLISSMLDLNSQPWDQPMSWDQELDISPTEPPRHPNMIEVLNKKLSIRVEWEIWPNFCKILCPKPIYKHLCFHLFEWIQVSCEWYLLTYKHWIHYLEGEERDAWRKGIL